MFLTDRKLERRISELEQYRYRDIIGLKSFAAAEDDQGVVNPALPSFQECEVLETGDSWKGRDRYLWLHKDMYIPAEWKGKRVVGIFDYGNTGAGNNSGFESMLYINGKMYQGVDVNHKEVFFDEALCGTTVDVTFRLWSGLEGGGVPKEQEHRIARADLAWLDEKADDFYYTASMVWQTIGELDEYCPEQHELRKALDGACHCIDWSVPGSEEFYDSVHQADDYLNECIDRMDKNSMINVYCVGHTHIDVAWLWRLKHTREKCSRSFSTVLRLMELYPEYIFLHEMAADKDGNTFAAVINRELDIGIKIEYNVNELPYFMQWKSIAPGDYVIGLEPANSSVYGRPYHVKAQDLHRIEPLSQETKRIVLTFLAGRQLDAIKQEAADLRLLDTE